MQYSSNRRFDSCHAGIRGRHRVLIPGGMLGFGGDRETFPSLDQGNRNDSHV